MFRIEIPKKDVFLMTALAVGFFVQTIYAGSPPAAYLQHLQCLKANGLAQATIFEACHTKAWTTLKSQWSEAKAEGGSAVQQFRAVLRQELSQCLISRGLTLSADQQSLYVQKCYWHPGNAKH